MTSNENSSAVGIVVDCNHADSFRRILKDANLLDRSKRSMKLEGRKVGLPLMEKSDGQLTEKLSDCLDKQLPNVQWSIEKLTFPSSKKMNIKSQHQILIDSLKPIIENKGYAWTKDLEQEVPNSWEKHGDLVLLSEKFFKSEVWNELGNELWETVTMCLSCGRLAKRGTISTDGFRSPQVTLLLGDDGWVQHTDNGIRYTYDVTKCMFSSGNITEKLRVASFDCTNETVVDLYAGIGYFTLPYLVYTGAHHVYACEWNPDAAEALKKNIQLNSVQDKCTVLLGDNRQTCPKGIADRVNLGLIPTSEPGWHVACAALKPQSGGILHIHDNVESGKQTESDQMDTEKTKSACSNMAKENVSTLTEESSFMWSCNNDCRFQDDRVASCDVSQSDSNFHKQRHDKCLYQQSKSEEKKSDTGTEPSFDNSKQKLSKENNVHKWSKAKKIMPQEWADWAVNVSHKIKEILTRENGGSDWTTNILHIEHVKSYAPHVDHLVLDLECRPVMYTND